MRMRRIPEGLLLMGVVLAAAAVARSDSPKPTANTCSNCVVCSTQAACPAMQAAKCEFVDLQNGSAMLITVSDPAKVEEFHQGWDQCKGAMDKAMKMSPAEAQSHL